MGKKEEKSKSNTSGEGDEIEMNDFGDNGEHLVLRTVSSYESDTIEIVDIDDPQTNQPKEEYHPDSVHTSIDALRSIAVILMVVRTVIARFTYGANPLTKAFGGDWLPPIFLFASGARFVFCFCLKLTLYTFMVYLFIIISQSCCRTRCFKNFS